MSHAGALAEAVLVMHFNIVWGGLSPFWGRGFSAFYLGS